MVLMEKSIYRIRNKKHLFSLADELLKRFARERVFVFYGTLGAGKTTFIKEFCKALSVQDMVQSPTFAIINEYSSRKYGPVYHMDFYRIEKTEEVFEFGLEEYLDSKNYCFIEWPEKIEPLLPEDIVIIRMEVASDQTRTIEVGKDR